MRSAPNQGYHNPPEAKPPEQIGHTEVLCLEAFGNRELPDATLTEAQRLPLREGVRTVAARLSSHEMMYLANAFEDAAIRKRVEEDLAS